MITWADHILSNFWLKIFSLALAMLIWFNVSSSVTTDKPSFTLTPWMGESDRTLTNLPVNLLIQPQHGQRFNVFPATVDINVEGPPETVDRLTPSDIKIYAHIVDVNSPMASFPLKPILPSGVSLRSISPSSVSVESTSEPFRLFPAPPIK